ncbi:hypothetical protein C0J52_08200 [Blattella germanica]|nr:hypothetical protein C0J52_08200 [Blattella germanica]
MQVKVPSKSVTDGVPKRKTGSGTKRSSAPPTKTSASSEAARKAREENRRKMMEERRKAMKEKKDAGSSGQVEIFVPQENDVSSYELSDNEEGADSLSTPSSSSRVGSTCVSSSESESDSDNETCDEATNRGGIRKTLNSTRNNILVILD